MNCPASAAAWAERAGIDIVGIGDSLGMTLYGHENTLAITVDQMIEHTRAVRRGAPNTFAITAMPYGSYATKEIAVHNAVRMMKESGADALKLQGGREKFEIIKAVADAGVPVMSHVGLIPHHVHHHGGFKMQGRTAEDALKIIDNAKAIEEAYLAQRQALVITALEHGRQRQYAHGRDRRPDLFQLAQGLDLRRIQRDPEEHYRQGNLGSVRGL